MKPARLLLIPILFAMLMAPAVSQDGSGIDPEALIERILAVDRDQYSQIQDLVFDAEYIESEDKGDKGIKEKVRLVKKVYVKYFEDSAWFAEEYLEFYKEGERQSDEELIKEAADREEKKQKRKGRDISARMLKPFYPEYRELYTIDYLGVADERVDDLVCHQFRVTANDEVDSLVNGDFYFEAEDFHLVRADFSPAKLVKKLMFRLKELNMTVRYGPTPDGYWLPKRFDLRGRGKAAFFIGVKFSGTEFYRNPTINSGLDDSVFGADHGE